MAINTVEASVSANGKEAALSFLLDSGAGYTSLPEAVWRDLGLVGTRAHRETLADGSTFERRVSECGIRFPFGETRTPVMLGEEGDVAVLGWVTLAELGMMLDPLTREIVPMTLRMAAARPAAPLVLV